MDAILRQGFVCCTGCWMLDAGCWKIEVKSEKQEEIIEPPNFEYPIFNF